MNVDEAIQSAIKYYQEGCIQSAERICAEILEVQPNDIIAINLCGIMSYQLKNYDSAIQHMKKLIAIDPNDAQAYYILGHSMQVKDNLEDAITYYQKALQVNPELSDVYYNLAIIFQDQKRLNDAKLSYQKVLQINPDDASTYYNLGLILQEEEHLEEAITYYRKAIQLSNKLFGPYYKISEISHLQGERFAADSSIPTRTWLPGTMPSYQDATDGAILTIKWLPGTMPYQVDNEKKLLYVEIPKVASSSIKRKLYWEPLFGNNVPREITDVSNFILGYYLTNTLAPYKNFFKFTVVRDPYTRFMSAYFNLIHPTHRDRRNYHVIKNLGIENWPDDILTDPNKFLHNVDIKILNKDPHTSLQKNLLPKDLKELDYIGRLENMKDLEQRLSQVLNYPIIFDSHYKGAMNNYNSMKIDVKRLNLLYMEDYETLHEYYKPLKVSP